MQNIQSEKKAEFHGELKSRKKAKYLLIFTAIYAFISITFFSIQATHNQLEDLFQEPISIFGLVLVISFAITIFVFSIQLIVYSLRENHEYKTLGLVSGILIMIFLTIVIGFILCIIYVIKTKDQLNIKPKIKNSDNIFKTRKYTKILLIIQPFVFVFYLLSIILGFESLDSLITFILLSASITIVNIVFSVLLIYSSSEENHIYKNEAKICGILSLLTVSGVIAFFMCISYLIKTSRLINNQNKNI